MQLLIGQENAATELTGGEEQGKREKAVLYFLKIRNKKPAVKRGAEWR